jgi:hypothetical protein
MDHMFHYVDGNRLHSVTIRVRIENAGNTPALDTRVAFGVVRLNLGAPEAVRVEFDLTDAGSTVQPKSITYSAPADVMADQLVAAFNGAIALQAYVEIRYLDGFGDLHKTTHHARLEIRSDPMQVAPQDTGALLAWRTMPTGNYSD